VKATKRSDYPNASEKEVTIQIPEPAVLHSLAGDQDQHLKVVEQTLEIKISHTHGALVLSGQDSEVELAADLFYQMKRLIERGERFSAADVERAIKQLAGNQKFRLEELFVEQVKIAGRKHAIVPKTPRQREYLDAIRAYDLVFGIGPAGTGKTYLAMSMAVSALLNKEVKRIILTRPAVEAGEKLGFLPGDLVEKVNPYLRPLYDALHDMVDADRAKELVEKGTIEVAPLAFMRGRTLSNAFVILDEAQNTTSGQMRMFLTRLGPGSKSVVTGDVTQIDLPRGHVSGLVEAMHVLKVVKGLSFVHFNEEDVIRHPLVGRIVAAYGKRKETQEG
jgi:phosphate starvation-inducible PhoH-like protein